MKIPVKLIVIFFSIACPALGLAIGLAAEQPLLGVIVGCGFLLLLGLPARYSRDQWILVIVSAVAWMLFSLLPFPAGLVYMSSSVMLGFSIASIALGPLYGGNLVTAAKAILSLLLGQPVSTQVVKPPPTILQPGTPDRMGPARITVSPNAVAILEKGGEQTEIVGPGVITTKPYEYTQMIYNLRPQHVQLPYTAVMTKDLISTDVRVGITYGIHVGWKAREGKRQLRPEEVKAIQAFHVRATNWEDELRTVVESAVRTVLGDQFFEAATSTSSRQNVENTISNRVQFVADGWGIRVYRTHLIAVQPRGHVSDARELRFIADTNADTLGRYERARAEAWSAALSILGEGYADATDNGVPTMIIVRELLRRIMEQAARNATTSSMVPRELKHLFDELVDSGPPDLGSPQNGTSPPTPNIPVP